jgi:protein O-GlcNAc transferase
VAMACGLASDIPALVERRASARARMARSPLCDSQRYVREVEAAYREMWRRRVVKK